MSTRGPGGHSTRGSHRLAQVGTCPRKWYWRWVRGLKPNVAPVYFIEGTLAHIALAYYRAQQLHQQGKATPQWFFEESMHDCLLRNGKGYPAAVQLGVGIYAAYQRRYAQLDPWELVAIEEEYKASLGQIRQLLTPGCASQSDDNEIFTSRIDLMLRTNGYLWACDYKTTKYASRGHLSAFNYEGEYAVNWQFALQTAILRCNFGSEFRGVVIERILKTSPHDFDRTPAPLHEAIFRSLPATLTRLAATERALAREIAAAAQAGEDMEVWQPSGSFWACYSWGLPCEYRQLCTAENARQLKETVVREYHEE